MASKGGNVQNEDGEVQRTKGFRAIRTCNPTGAAHWVGSTLHSPAPRCLRPTDLEPRLPATVSRGAGGHPRWEGPPGSAPLPRPSRKPGAFARALGSTVLGSPRLSPPRTEALETTPGEFSERLWSSPLKFSPRLPREPEMGRTACFLDSRKSTVVFFFFLILCCLSRIP